MVDYPALRIQQGMNTHRSIRENKRYEPVILLKVCCQPKRKVHISSSTDEYLIMMFLKSSVRDTLKMYAVMLNN